MEVYPTTSDDDSLYHSESCDRWFKMPSRLWDTEVGSDPYLLQLLAYLCDRARIKDGSDTFGEGKGRRNFYLAAGELIVGRHQAAKDLRCPPSTVRNRLERLKELGLIKTRACKKYTIVTIVFMVQQATKKRQAKKDNRKPTVYPANSLTDERNTDAKRTTEGQVKNERLANDFVDKSALAVEEKGQQKDNRRTTEGQQKDTNKKDKKIRRKEGGEDSFPLPDFDSVFRQYKTLPEDDIERMRAKAQGYIRFDGLSEAEAEHRLRKAIDGTLADLRKNPPPASSTAPTNRPDLDAEVKPFFKQRTGGPFAWEEPTHFYVVMNGYHWKRRNGEPIDWRAEAMRETVPEPQQGKRETSTHDGGKLSADTTRRLRAINRAPEIVPRPIPSDAVLDKDEVKAAILKAGEAT